ncbi:acyl-CoA carboxylase subunit epsilon [Amycolatopsis silviterrae]|uniref:Acyl-CoA carboxylase subunit epsilon n=1 Tax=Amycolatopsis silviterrae TaxID=1656914 RepID=A0ABW5H7Y5_9PSEU
MNGPEVVVLRGAPEDDEIAAVIAALWLAVGRDADRPASTPLRPGWTSRTYRMPGTWAARTHQPVTRQ